MPIKINNIKVDLPDIRKVRIDGHTVYLRSKGLCFTANADNSTISYIKNGTVDVDFQVSADGKTYSSWDGSAITLNNVGDKIFVKNTKETLSTSESNYIQFAMTGSIAASGNVMSLINHAPLSSYCFYRLFFNCSSLTSAPKLPATTLAGYCYYEMFEKCSELVSTPDLPAKNLAEQCYRLMFYKCAKLENVSSLPATTLASFCYTAMFSDCESLVNAPELPAMTLVEGCYKHMFAGCVKLISAPALPAETLANSCYECMFSKCESITTTPTLSATTLAYACCFYMFSSCINLTSATNLPATTLVESCYYGMFEGCSSLKVRERGGLPDNLIFTCPSTIPSNAVRDMFYHTSGTYQADPVENEPYYYY